MFSTIELLTSVSCILSVVGPALSAPRARPESVGADGTCSPPTYEIQSATKLKQGPYLVSGARSDANAGGGELSMIEASHLRFRSLMDVHAGEASFTNTNSVSTTITVGLGADLSL